MLLFFNKGTEEKLAPETRSVALRYKHMPVHTGRAVIMEKIFIFANTFSFKIKSG